MKLLLPILLLMSVYASAQKKELKDDTAVLHWRMHIKQSIIGKAFVGGIIRIGVLKSTDTLKIDTLTPTVGKTTQYKLSLKLVYGDSSRLESKMVSVGDSITHVLEMNFKGQGATDSVRWKVFTKKNRMSIVVLSGVKGRKIRYFYKREEIK